MFTVKTAEEVFEIIERNFAHDSLPVENVPLGEAVGRVLAADLYADMDIPGFHRSSVDGYAVIASDTFGASDSIPAQLALVGEVRMGEVPERPLSKGQAIYVPTGGQLPENADAMVMIEYTEDLGDGFIYLQKAAAPGNHVVFRGDDVREGCTVAQTGTLLRPQDIGALAAAGHPGVPVRRKIRAGILSTGDEVVDIRERNLGARVRDINSYLLQAGLRQYGAEPVFYGIIRDDDEIIRRATEKALRECDVVLISGGSSVGTRDVTGKVIDSLGEPGVLVHGIAVKPGKPTILGKVQGKAVFGLPGHPASAYMIFKIFVCRLLDRISGARQKVNPAVQAAMACNYPSNNGREEYVPVRLENTPSGMLAHPLFGKSGMVSLLTSADGYVHLSRSSEGIASGKIAEVTLF